MRFLPVILLVALVVYALVDCVRSDDADMPVGLPKALWVILIVVFPGAGALAWLVVSRVSRQAAGQVRGGAAGRPSRPGPRRPAPRPLAPDDDPEFLAGLDRQRPAEPPAPEPTADTDADDETTDDGEPGTRS
ncbi:PLD nuclease N-terminal domain-containing protein [Georgenia satyanarayanai]|uniref:PLD nuclease N-terminal domain-containing protein n=1 Tax=Georgenia satyanarayanai TaxID=860221 RepID=UPI00126566E4|nr:PLD nuclease N-terminal domain-containing protein [Georgenia satyanarayanai]